MKEHIHSVKAKSKAGNIRVKYIITEKGQSRKKIYEGYKESHLGNLRIMLEIQRRAAGPGESAAVATYLSLRIFV